MWPWGHLAIGYLVYVAISESRDWDAQTGLVVAAVALGTQFPDLVDKPLAWTFAVLPSGRSLAHSLITATLVIALVYHVAAQRNHRNAARAFAIGYVSHCLADLGPGVVAGLLRGDWSQLQWTTYLLWPLYPAPPYPHDGSFTEHFLAFTVDPYVLSQFGLLAVAVAVWGASGAPGLTRIRD